MAASTTSDTATIVLSEAPENFKLPSLTGDIVPVQIGDDALLHLHAAVLTKTSEFFKNAMKPEWRTDITKPVDISDVDLTIFEAYCGWLYTGKVVHHDKQQCYRYLARLYVLGERLLDVTFQDAIIAAIIRFQSVHSSFPGNKPVQIIYGGTHAGSPARRLLVDLWAFNAKPTWIELAELTKHTCSDFVEDLLRELVEIRDVPGTHVQRPWIAHPEFYRIASSESK